MDGKTLPLSMRVEISGGCPIRSAIANAIEMSRRLGCHVTFDFIETPVGVSPDSDADEVYESYLRWPGGLRYDEPADDARAGADRLRLAILDVIAAADAHPGPIPPRVREAIERARRVAGGGRKS